MKNSLWAIVFLLSLGALMFFSDVQLARSDYAWVQTIYVRADGRIEPSSAPISTVDNVTYILTDSIVGNIPGLSYAVVVERDNVVIDGAGHSVKDSNPSTFGGSYGVLLWERNNVTVKNFKLDGFHLCIFLSGSSGNNIQDNYMTNSWIGLSMSEYSDNNVAQSNNLTDLLIGVRTSYSFGNKIFHNRFTNSSVDVEGGASSTWDDGYPSGGNYWSHLDEADLYSGPFQNETGSDGIIDTPYVIDENNRDNYPLMGLQSSLLGDINGDATVDLFDAVILANAFNSVPTSPNWNPNADINGDDIVDLFDAIILAGNFGQTA